MELNAIFARQPILDSQRRLYGYELLYRRNIDAVVSGDTEADFDGELATAYILQVLSSISIEEITGGAKAFVNFPASLLLEGYATLFPPEHLVIEILENTEPTPDLIYVLRQLKEFGYGIALDDFWFEKKYMPLVELADIIKIEVSGEQESIENMFRVLDIVNKRNCVVLAERVETQAMFNACLKANCKLFQGYFFSKPVTISRSTLEANRANYVRLISYVNNNDIEFGEVSQIIKQDVALTYKLLTLVNSSHFSRGNRISEIEHAVVMLGEDELKKWVSFIALNNVCSDKPSELVKMSMSRAYFCSNFAEAMGHSDETDKYFLVGLFSLLDALMDRKMSEVLANVNLSGDVFDALTGVDNKLSRILKCIKSFEKGDWDEIEEYTDGIGCSSESIMRIYLDALKRSDNLSV